MTDHHLEEHKPMDLASFRQQLAQKRGKEYWRSLQELVDSEEFDQLVKQEFPRQSILLDSLNRRDFLKVLGASLALAGLAACTPQSGEKILPYVKPPEQLVPAKSNYFASSMVLDGYARGVLIETTMGRPIKVEGNPKHPDSLGKTDVFMQASILDLYDPDRVKQVTQQGAAKTWQDFTAAAGSAAGGNLRILSGPVTSPTLIRQMEDLLNGNNQARWVQYSPVGRANAQAGAVQAFGQPFEAVYDFSKADVILSLDCDFMFVEPGHVRYSREFGLRHQPISASGTMNRLYVVEPAMSLTGSNADHHLAVRPGQVETFARALAAQLGVDAGEPGGEAPGQNWLDALAQDLQRAGANALVLAGERQPAAVHALAHAMNAALGSLGNTVTLRDPVIYTPEDEQLTLAGLVDELNGGQVDTLVILEGNPAYATPADLDFAAAMPKAKTSIYLAHHMDETAALATWVIPAAHYMETWSDARAFDGTPSIIQPVIEPLYGGKSAHELIAALAGDGEASGYDLVRATWQDALGGGNFENTWRDALSAGVLPVEETAGGGAPNVDTGALSGASAAAAPAADTLDLVLQPDYSIWDGRFSNNAWLQELPKPLTKLTWDNAAQISPNTASRLGLETGNKVTLAVGERSVEAAIFVEPGLPDNVVLTSLGYGRGAGGNVQQGLGFNAYALRTTEAPWFASGVTLSRIPGEYVLATPFAHWYMENRELVREATLAEYEEHPNFAQEGEMEEPPTLYGEHEYEGYSWGMSINLNTCIGCNACVVACQAENNVPTVGKDQVHRGRAMHWLRIDRYYKGRPEKLGGIVYQPLPCMHCDKAPCEPVCPVEATSHSAEGINEMTYNRCVGTRYCANNCPYKVRRFNFYKFADDTTPSLRALHNPDVTVRARGVMEKCTYCVQRVNTARIQAEVEGRRIEEGEVMTACQQACPTDAIIFGDLNNPEGAARQLKETPLNYALLGELGTRPRTTYLAKVRNPNPMITDEAEG